MNTPTHLIVGAAVFARPDAWRVTLAAILGSFAPDASLYLMAGWHLYVIGTEPRIVFNVLYFSDTWQSIFAIDNSVFLWGGLLGFALWREIKSLTAFAGSGLFHLLLDFPLHHDDGRMHFWPVSDWIFQSPVSYWDRSHYGGIVGPLEVVMSTCLIVLLWRRFQGFFARIILMGALVLQLLPSLLWVIVF